MLDYKNVTVFSIDAFCDFDSETAEFLFASKVFCRQAPDQQLLDY